MRYLILGLIFATTGAYSQVRFNLKDYASDKFRVTFDTTKMSGFSVVLIVARPVAETASQFQAAKIWVQRLNNGEVLERYLGEVETERGVYKPCSQPIKDTYVIVECGEYSGEINLIARDGNFVKIPGYYYALNKPGYIYTKQANTDSIVYKYDLKRKRGIDLRSKLVVADGLLFEKVDGACWIK